MKVVLSWIREFVDVPGTPEEIGARLSVRGLALEGIERHGSEDVLDFDVTANRPDCLSIFGIAREIATVYGLLLREAGRAAALPLNAGEQSVKAPASAFAEAPAGKSAVASTIPITIEEPDLCRRYVGAIADVTIGPSPDWMQTRLMACDIRPISNVVDVTNYVLLELGQPMHAFDYAKLRGPAIVVRRARSGETLKTLDGKQRTLDPDMLVIADAEHASAIGGVMGGGDSEVSDSTRRIVFESAWFKPQSVRATSRRLGLRTEASYRFERGMDLEGPARAMARALTLLETTGAGRRCGPMIDVFPTKQERRSLVIDAEAIRHLLGMDVPDDETERILASLGFDVQTLGGWHAAAPEASTPMGVGVAGRAWQITVPSWRVDVTRAVDAIEEVGRHYGFEHLPVTFPAVEQAPLPSDPRIARDARARRALLAMGFSEAITFAFIESRMAAPYACGETPLALANPLSEKFATLRPSLLPGLVDAVGHNRRHGQRDVRLFEIGTRFSPRGETRAAAAAWTGAAVPEHWSGGRRDVDFFDIKGVADELCAALDVTPAYAPAVVPYLIEGRTADVRVDGAVVGAIGQLDPAIADARDLPSGDAVFVLEFDLDRVTAQAPTGPRLAQPLPRYPSVVRDVSILVDDALSAESVRGTIRTASVALAGVPLVDVREFDRYQGKGIPAGKMSLSVRLTFQAPDRTLTDADVSVAMESIVGALVKELGAVQR